MAKHRRHSDKAIPVDQSEFESNSKAVQDFRTSTPETNKDLKSILLSGTKYIYIIIITAFLSGIFTPLTIGVEIEDVIFGMLTIFLGLGGGVLMFLAIKKSSMKIFFGGLGIIIAAFILIHELSGRPLL